MARRTGGTRDCNATEARTRLAKARRYLEAGALLVGDDTLTDPSASASLHAGLLAADAVCCAVLGERSASANHNDAVALLRRTGPDGVEAAKHLKRLLDMKDRVEYSERSVPGRDAELAQRAAEHLIDLAERRMPG